MNMSRNRGLGESHGTRELDRYIRRMEKMREIDKITDLAGLPEYLSDEDPDVVVVAKVKLEELSP